jgi:integrase
MARQTQDQPTTTREARKKLAVRAEPYWRHIDAGAALGYRKTKTGGTWIARAVVEGRYREGAIGRADDAIKPDGVNFLEYRQAVEKAKVWASAQHHIAAGLEADHASRAPYTVADAIADYLEHYRRNGGKDMVRTRQTIDAHILPALGAVRLDRLTRARITGWRNSVADAAPRLRSAKNATEQRHRTIDPADAEAQRRRRRSSTNRVLTVLKAALNHARQAERVHTDAAWATVKPFRDADAPKVRYLTDAECARLVNACPADLRQVVTAALLTGMRYGELAALPVSGFNPQAGSVSIATSKSGKPRHVWLTDEGREFFARAAAGKAAGALLLTREGGGLWGKSHQTRPLLDACKVAKIAPAISFHILRHTYASRLALAGSPMAVIAEQLGHAGTRMTERHYAHLTPSYVGDTVRALFGKVGVLPASNLATLPARAAG